MPLLVSSGSLNSTSGAGSTFSFGTSGSPYISVECSGTFTGINLIFEGSIGGSIWYPLPGYRVDIGLPEATAIIVPNSTKRTWTLRAGLYNSFRIRCTARSTGTVSLVAISGPGNLITGPNIAQEYRTTNVGKSTIAVAAGTTGANTVALASGPGILHKAIVTTAGTAAIIIYDNATTNSGTKLYNSDTTLALSVVDIELPFSNGLTVRKANASAACTLVYTLLN